MQTESVNANNSQQNMTKKNFQTIKRCPFPNCPPAPVIVVKLTWIVSVTIISEDVTNLKNEHNRPAM